MLQLTCEIIIGEERFNYVNEVQIVSAWKNLTDTATIKLPRNLITRNNLRIGKVLKVGQVVEIKLGYNHNTSTRFKGYIDTIGAATDMVEIKCQDEMWILKQSSYTKSWKEADLEGVLSYLKSETGNGLTYKISGNNLKLGAFTVEGLSTARILQRLKDEYGVYSFFRDEKLTVGGPYEQTDPPRTILEYGRNVISWKNLNYKEEADVKSKIKLINIKPDGVKEESVKGDDGGEERVFSFYNLGKADFEKHAEELLAQMKYSGYRGRLIAFGEPEVKHGGVVNIIDKRVDSREGDYYIDAVETTFGPSGMRQMVTLGPKVK